MTRGRSTEDLVLEHVRAAGVTTLDDAARATARPRARVRLALANLVGSGEVFAGAGYAVTRFAADAATAARIALDERGLTERVRAHLGVAAGRSSEAA